MSNTKCTSARGADDRDSEAAIGRLPVPSRLGPIALENVASFSSGEAPSDIRRLSRQRQVTVTVNLLPGTSQADVQDEITAAAEQIGLERGLPRRIQWTVP